MTTARSPLRVLKAQADAIAKMLKSAGRGEPVPNDPAGKIRASLEKGIIKFCVAMDDKLLSIEMPWDRIRQSSEVSLAAMILREMRESRVH